jgi:hypothetical protein
MLERVGKVARRACVTEWLAFERAAPRRFDLVVGADGLHSNVRHLVFGAYAGRTQFLGGYLAVVSVPKTLAHEGEMISHIGAGRLAAIYSAQPLDDARAVFLFCTKRSSSITTEMPCGSTSCYARRSPGCTRRWTAGLASSTLAGGPGSWEAERVRETLQSTVAVDDEYLMEHRTEPVVIDLWAPANAANAAPH